MTHTSTVSLYFEDFDGPGLDRELAFDVVADVRRHKAVHWKEFGSADWYDVEMEDFSETGIDIETGEQFFFSPEIGTLIEDAFRTDKIIHEIEESDKD